MRRLAAFPEHEAPRRQGSGLAMGARSWNSGDHAYQVTPRVTERRVEIVCAERLRRDVRERLLSLAQVLPFFREFRDTAVGMDAVFVGLSSVEAPSKIGDAVAVFREALGLPKTGRPNRRP